MKIKNTRSRRAQTMMEYIIIVALIAVASIPVATILGNVFRDRVMHAADKIVNGDHAPKYRDRGDALIREGNQDSKVKKGMGDFYNE